MKNIILISFICQTLFIQSQTKTNSTNSNQNNNSAIANHLKVYKNSIHCKDFGTAISALNFIVVHYEKTGQYQDTLAMLYYNTNQLYSALIWAENVLKTNPQNQTMLEIAAESYSANNELIKSLESFQKLYDLNKSSYILYKIADLQLKVKRIYECLNSTIIAESKTDTKDLYYFYKIGNQSFQTPIMSSFYNIRGMALYELGNKNEALNAFKISLMIDSTNLIAQDNYKILSQEIANLNKPIENKTPQQTQPIEESKPIDNNVSEKKKRKK